MKISQKYINGNVDIKRVQLKNNYIGIDNFLL